MFNIRGPFLALVAMDSFEKKEKCTEDWIFAKMQQEYKSEDGYFRRFDEIYWGFE